MSRERVDVVVHIPLEVEYREFVQIFPTIANLREGVHVTYRVQAPSGLNVVVLLQEKMGRSAAHAACAHALERFEPKLYVCLGIAGGLSGDMRLGDVCYTGNLTDIYDNSKITDAEGGGVDIGFDPTHFETDRAITSALGYVRTMTELRHLDEFWSESQAEFVASMGLGPVIGRKGAEETIGGPKSLNGHIVCGAVAASNRYRERLSGISRNFLAIETESGTVFDLCKRKGVPALTIRGISDYADDNKKRLEGATKDLVRKIAARNAATFLHMQLQNPTLLDELTRIATTGQATQLPLLGGSSELGIPAAIDIVGKAIDSKLRELSPEFRSKPQGYRLPTPRLREIDAIVPENGKRSRASAMELTSALARHHRILVHVPRTYPDPALSWVLASGLLLAEIAGKKVIPVVIAGAEVGPPRSGFSHLAELKLDEGLGEKGGQYVFIVDAPPLSSKTKTSFLAEEIKRWPEAKVIFVTRDEKSLINETDFARRVSAQNCEVCDVSFAEMAMFLENSFSMPAAEAEVIALKLRSVFQRFALPAHPSFFAGIPPELFASLLQANRRSELIQLAVDGYLSFVVAADREPVRMSRTYRANFLRQFVVNVNVEKRNYTQAELVACAQQLSDEYDYGLNALSFIASFEEQGILHFESGYARITLPFVESYLLADELAKNPDLAARYFDVMSDDIDLLTLDLYAEIGPDPALVARVAESLEAALAAVQTSFDEHILLSNKIFPAFIKNQAQLVSIQNQLRTAKDALDSNASQRDEKAKLLDLFEKVNEDIAGDDGDDDDIAEEVRHLSDLMRQWYVACVVLGSGAESIKGEERQRLASLLIAGGDCLLHAMTAVHASFDYEEVKRRIYDDAEFRARVGIEDEDEYRRLIGVLVDLFEYSELNRPMHWVLSSLLDEARQRIIGNSVGKANAETKIGRTIKGMWLTEIDEAEGKPILKAAIADLPHSFFLRMALTNLMVIRVKWQLSDKAARYTMLDMAESLMKPMNPHFDKGEFHRLIAKDDLSRIEGGGADH